VARLKGYNREEPFFRSHSSSPFVPLCRALPSRKTKDATIWPRATPGMTDARSFHIFQATNEGKSRHLQIVRERKEQTEVSALINLSKVDLPHDK